MLFVFWSPDLITFHSYHQILTLCIACSHCSNCHGLFVIITPSSWSTTHSRSTSPKMESGDRDASTGLSDFASGRLSSLTPDPSFMEGSEVDESIGGDPSDDFSDGGHSQSGQRVALREQDRFLPIANVSRIMKVSIPKSGKIAKEAKECVQECVSEFVSFITSEASDRCHQEKRKTINGEDILSAMQTLGFDNYVGPLKLYLNKFREAQKGERTSSGSVDHGNTSMRVFSLELPDGSDVERSEAPSDQLLSSNSPLKMEGVPSELYFQLDSNPNNFSQSSWSS